jgi:putative ABC transport system substrate-binding protein
MATDRELPSAYLYSLFVAEGGLASYIADLLDLFRRPASYVDRIVKGEEPTDLSVVQPTTALRIKSCPERVVGSFDAHSPLYSADQCQRR